MIGTDSYELQVGESSDGVVRTVAGRAGGLGRVKQLSGRVALAGHWRLVHCKQTHAAAIKCITYFSLPFSVSSNSQTGKVLIYLKFKPFYKCHTLKAVILNLLQCHNK